MGQPGQRSEAVGLYVLMFGVMVLALAGAAAFGKPLLAVLLAISAGRAFLSAGWNLGGGHPVLVADGALAVAISAFSVYGGLALLLEDMQQKPVLPILRIGAAKRSFRGDLREQLQRIETEAGVRQQL